MSRLLIASLLGLLTLLSGCANFGYYWQSAHGQFDIWGRARDIARIIDDPATPEALRKKLARVSRMRDFASRDLGLPDNASYRRYADIERKYVVWNVFAASEFSTKPVRSCFLIVGCVGYRGFFSKMDADEFAAKLGAEGYDVFVGGVPAYSTLGWFADPVLNTFIQYPDPGIARLIFHELAHQLVYVRDDTEFNESFAVAVAREGVRRWLERQESESDRLVYERTRFYREGFVQLVQRYRERLDALYNSGLAPQAMRVRKGHLFDEMLKDYGRLKATWGGYTGYDRWFAQRPNNALLASVVIYTGLVPAFQALLKREGGNLPRFYAAVKELAQRDKEDRDRRLRNMLPQAAPAAR